MNTQPTFEVIWSESARESNPGLSSGVARVSCTLGQETFLRPPSTKAIEFEVKNRCKKYGRSKSRTLFL